MSILSYVSPRGCVAYMQYYTNTSIASKPSETGAERRVKTKISGCAISKSICNVKVINKLSECVQEPWILSKIKIFVFR